MDAVTGRPHPDLERAFAGTLAKLKAKDPLAPVAIVAASRRVADRLKEVALEARPEGVAGLHFNNLHSFARELYDEAMTRDPGWTLLMDKVFAEHLVLRLIWERFEEGCFLPRALYSRRGGLSLLGLIHELKDAAVDPDAAVQAVPYAILGVDEAPKLAEIFSLYKLYQDQLAERRIHERSDVARIADEFVPESKRLVRYRHVIGYGFYDLVQTQVDLWKAVGRRIDTTIFIPRLEKHPYAEDLLTVLGATSRRISSVPKRAKTRVVSASGGHDEVWAAAKQILAWIDEGVPLYRIGVVARTLDPYSDLIEAVFCENRIPYVSSHRRSQEREPLLKAARQLFSLGDFPRPAVLDLLGSPYFAHEEGAEPELWDAASRLMGIGKGEEEWRRRLGGSVGGEYAYRRGDRGEERHFVLPARQVELFWGAVERLLEAPLPPIDWKSVGVWASDRLHSFLRPLDRKDLYQDLDSALEGLGNLGGPVLDAESAVRRVIGSLSSPIGDPRSGGVQVLDAMQARCIPFERLAILGLNERVFPRYILEDAFIRDAVRSRLEHRLGNRMARKLAGYEEERLLFALLLGSAREALLTYQRSDEKGRLQVPSVFLRDLKVDADLPRHPGDRLKKEDLLRLTPREAGLRTGAVETLARTFDRDMTLLTRAAPLLRATQARDRLTPYDGVIDAREYWKRVSEFGLSPTSLERMSACPFQYFASKVLDLEELIEPEIEESMDPAEVGSLYHDVLERFIRGGEKDLDGALDAAFKRIEDKRSIPYPLLWEAEKRRVRAVLSAFVAADQSSREGFKPEDLEVELKGELPLAIGGRPSVAFRGFLDRVDLSKEAFRVIDYKSRRSSKYRMKLETGLLQHGRFLQAAIYTLLAQSRYKERTGSFAYYFVEDAGEKTWRLELDETFWEQRGRFEAVLKNLLEGVARGRFFILPGDACKWCDFRTLCRKSHLPTRLRAENDSDARAWRDFPQTLSEEKHDKRSKRKR